MFECIVSFWDGTGCRYYEEGKSYDIDLEYMAGLGVLGRFRGAKEAVNKANEKKTVVTQEVVTETKKKGGKK